MNDNKPDFSCNTNDNTEPFPHFWEHCVGSGHATLALRADWQKQLTRCRKELGFKHVRFHGILSDDMGTFVNEIGKNIYSFFNADQIMDFLLSIGMRPFVELSFMPYALSSGPDLVFHYKANITLPKSFNDWAILIQTLVKHWLERYGLEEVRQWFFEVWNEPNLSAFWKGSQADYFKLYQYTANAIKGVDTQLRVGGPATAENAWISDFINFASSNGTPVDFISTHHYPTDAFGKPGDDTVAQLAASKRSILRDQVAETKRNAKDKPIYYTEWSTSSNPFDKLHDQPYAAAFIVKTVMEAQGYVEGYSYWTFSDIFEENYFSSIPFHGGFGLLNIYGIPKPAYRAYELMHGLSENRLPVQGKHDTVDVWIFKQPATIQVLLTNSALPTHPVKTEYISIDIHLSGRIKSCHIQRIDDTHANARRQWEIMGKPEYLSPADVITLETFSQMVKEPFEPAWSHGVGSLEIAITPQGIAYITIEME